MVESDSSLEIMDEEGGLHIDSDVEHEVMHGELVEEEEGSDIFDTDSSCERVCEDDDEHSFELPSCGL